MVPQNASYSHCPFLIIDNTSLWWFISRIIALVYDRVKPCCFSSQVNINLDDFQLSKTVFILARFCPKKLFISADEGCLILVPRSDLFWPRDFYGFERLKYRIFCPFSAKMQVEGFNYFMLSTAKMGHFSWIRSFFTDQNRNISSWGYDDCFKNSMVYSIKAFLSHYFR